MARRILKPGMKVKSNGFHPDDQEVILTIKEVITIKQGTTKGISLGVANLCKNKDIEVLTFEGDADWRSPMPSRFFSIIK